MKMELDKKELDILSRCIATEAVRCCDKYREELCAFIEASKSKDFSVTELAGMARALDETKSREAEKVETLMELFKKLDGNSLWGGKVKQALDELKRRD